MSDMDDKISIESATSSLHGNTASSTAWNQPPFGDTAPVWVWFMRVTDPQSACP